MSEDNKTFSPKDIERALGISKVQLHYWAKLLALVPQTKAASRGMSNVYTLENFVALRLVKTLFIDVGLKMEVAVEAVKGLFASTPFDTILRVVEEGEAGVKLVAEGFDYTVSAAPFTQAA